MASTTSILRFSGASDDTICAQIDDQRTEDYYADHHGWLVERGEGPPFTVRAYFTNGHWVFAVGFLPGADEDDGGDIGLLDMQVRQHPDRKYSTELIIRIAGVGIVTPLEWEA